MSDENAHKAASTHTCTENIQHTCESFMKNIFYQASLYASPLINESILKRTSEMSPGVETQVAE